MIGTRKNKKAFSLMEVIVSVAIFAFVILSTTEIFRLVINGQREAIASQNVQESLKYFFEVTAKEMRMAKKDEGACPMVPDDSIFAISNNGLGDVLYFKNFYNECVQYEIVADSGANRFQISRNVNSGFISPKEITMDGLDFQIDNTGQPVVTLAIQAHALGDDMYASQMQIQTSITSRYYR
jgi:prepilin-type N-terminal cleavage/methylation domain-containing protein